MGPLVPITTMGASEIGGRANQEDRFVVEMDMNQYIKGKKSDGKRRIFIGVFDGHGGQECSDFLARRFHLDLASHEMIFDEPEAAITDTWEKVERDFLHYQMNRVPRQLGKKKGNKKEKFHRDGSTATIVYIVENDAYVAYVGDSSAMLFSAKDSNETFGEAHNTNNMDEIRRACAAGGTIKRQDGEDATRAKKAKGIFAFTNCLRGRRAGRPPPRLSPGGLLVTRAFGDFHAKLEKYGGISDVILPTFEEIHHIKLDDSVEQIIVASDGLWDALSDVDVRASVTRTAMYASENNVQDIHSTVVWNLIHEAKEHPYWAQRNTMADNCTVVVLHCHTDASYKRFGDVMRT